MGLSFYVNGIRYDYEISYNEDFILSETLNFYPKGYKASFYTREFVAESSAANITFGTSAEIKKKAENTFVSNTLNNHTVLSTYAKVAFDEDVKAVSDLFAWITKSMHGINEYHDPNETFADMMRKVDEDPKMKSFFLQMIKKAIEQGYNYVYCMIDLDNKKEGKEKTYYVNLKNKYHGKHISKPKKGIDCHIGFFETERCTELFFLYYFKYTTKLYNHSNEV